MSKNTNARAIIKELALQAKQRLKNASLGENCAYQINGRIDKKNYLRLLTSKECKKPEITIKIINDYDENENFRQKVYTLLNDDENITNPLAKLVDQEKFESISEIEQEKYILELADKYNKVREAYYKQSAV